MSTKLRVFISSTMKDLGDARRAVVARLTSLNLEPVNAEGIYPDGGSSWDVLTSEIETCHLVILIGGESYGWVPKAGFAADGVHSVTHLEVLHAKSLGIPILSFFKRLPYREPEDEKKEDVKADAKARDAFRAEISDWETGYFRQEYDWIDDLKTKVGDALLDLFQRSTLREMTETRRAKIRTFNASSEVIFSRVHIPPGYVGRNPVLFAGAGVSASAGLPTAEVMIGLFGARLQLGEDGERILARHRFADVARVLEIREGRRFLEETVAEAFNIAQGGAPTAAHFAAIASFRHIITTNYDDLFERACIERGVPFSVHSPNSDAPSECSGVTIFKVDGSVGAPSTLVITEDDAINARKDHAYWERIEAMIGNRPIVIVGHSLRDENARKVLVGRGDGPGLYVSYRQDPMDDIVRGRFNLASSVGTADNFLKSFSDAQLRAAEAKDAR